MSKRKIIIISAGRSDIYRFLPIINELNNSNKAKIFIYLSQSYNNKDFGNFKNELKNFRILNNYSKKKYFNDNAFSMINNLNIDIKNLSRNVLKIKPDLILIMGDRYEMILGPIISIPNNIPLIHFFGGAVTEGAAIDELTRHALTKMSHFHFVLLKKYKKRLLQLGEERWRIKSIGLPSLSKNFNFKKIKINDLSKKFNFDFLKPFMLVTFHPVTAELRFINNQINSLIKAIKVSKMNAIVTYPNSDPKYNSILNKLKKNLKNKKKYLLINNLGEKTLFSLMKKAKLILGNSSSGIVEAATFKTPVINVGTRQNGKVKPNNVIDVDYDYKSILKGIKKSQSKEFLRRIKNIQNPYKANITTKKIANLIINLKINDNLIRKKFIDLNII